MRLLYLVENVSYDFVAVLGPFLSWLGKPAEAFLFVINNIFLRKWKRFRCRCIFQIFCSTISDLTAVSLTFDGFTYRIGIGHLHLMLRLNLKLILYVCLQCFSTV